MPTHNFWPEPVSEQTDAEFRTDNGLYEVHWLDNTLVLSPEGASEFSPALQRRVRTPTSSKSRRDGRVFQRTFTNLFAAALMLLPLAASAQQPSRAELAKIAQQPDGLREAARLAGHYVAIDLNPDDKPRSFISQEAKTYNNLSELAKDSTAIIIATPLDQSSRLSRSGTTILTEYRLRIEQDFKSHFKPNEIVSLGIPGGKVEFPNGTSAEIVTPNFPRMLIGNRYVIFVGPKEVSFRPTGGSQGIFELLKDGRTVKPFKSGFEQNSLSTISSQSQTKFLQNLESAAHD